MTVTIKIKCDNAAFESSEELPRILKELANKISSQGISPYLYRPESLLDINGNVVGKFTVKE